MLRAEADIVMPPADILVIDDSEDDRFHYRRLLKKAAYPALREAGTGAQGLAEAATLAPLCILLDYQLPDMTGVEFLGQLRQRHPDIPVIMLTGTDDTSVTVEALRQGADDYQVKGRITAETLPHVIDNAIHRRLLQTELQAKQARLEVFYQLIDRTSDMLLMLRLRDDRVIELNSAVPFQLGFQRHEVQEPGFFAARLPERHLALWQDFIHAPASSDLNLDTEFSRSSGAPIAVDINAHRTTIADEAYVMVAARDATKRRALENHLRRISLQDGLTGLNNRRAFDERMGREWDGAVQARAPLAVLMIDIDHFKLYNDTLGHLLGDECLRRVAAAMKGAIDERAQFLARYGGEEFVLLMPGADAASAEAACLLLLAAVRGVAIEHRAAPGGVVSISVGAVSLLPSAATDAAGLLKRADAALYRAKNQGRNGYAGDWA